MIFFLSPWFLLLMALFGAAGIYTIVQNIKIILITFVLLSIIFIIFAMLFNKWPARTFLGIVLILIATVIGFKIHFTSEINNEPVMIYRAIDNCIIYDEANELVHIPKDSIVAMYDHPEMETKEVSVIGASNICVWYYDGQTNTTTVSVKHGMDYWIDEGYEPNIWNLVEIKEITYKEFQKGNWWIS